MKKLLVKLQFKLASWLYDKGIIAPQLLTKDTNKKEKEELKILRREYDWYYQHSWFSLYFWDKVKRKVMCITYKVYSSIENYLLSEYFLEMEFYTPPLNNLEVYNTKNKTLYKGDYKCYLPIIIKAKEISEAGCISIAIRRELETEYGAQFINFSFSDKIVTKEKLKNIEEVVGNKFKGYENNIGYIDVITFIPKTTDSYNKTFNHRFDRKCFKVIKSGPLPFRQQNFEYMVKYYKTTQE